MKKVDSLLNLLKVAKHDTTRYNAYLELGNEFQDSNPDTAIYFHTQAEKISEKITNIDGYILKIHAIIEKGKDYYVKNQYVKAINYYNNSLIMYKKYLSSSNYIKSKILLAKIFNEIGNVYHTQSNYAKSVDYYFKALRINEEIKNYNGCVNNLNNIGVMYMEQNDHVKALEYYFSALRMSKKTGDTLRMSIILGNIGNVYSDKNNFSTALNYYFTALKLTEKINNKQNHASILCNIANLYYMLEDYENALNYYYRSLKVYEEINHISGQALVINNIGASYLYKKEYQKAEKYLKKSEKMNKELGEINYLEYNYEKLSELYEKTNKYNEALYYYKEHIKYRDSLFREENQKALIQKEMQYKHEKEMALKEAEHQKQLAIQQKERERQRIVMWSIGGGLVLVAGFSVLLFNRLQVTRKQKRIIEEQKQIVEEQKQLVEEKNKEITDSIIYAKRIQTAILPSMNKWKEHLPDSFVLYLPKDIVAGDFYWMEVVNNYIYVAAADCTGHGVPGAMVSVVCSNALTKAVLEERLTETSEILNRTRELVIEKLTSEENIRDGMDIAFVRIEKGTRKIQFSGANRSLYIFTSVAELAGATGFIELKGDKQPIGRYEDAVPFSQKKIEVIPESILYLTTDGYADQFGGEKGKKIGSKKFVEILKEVSVYSMEVQKQKLEEYFAQWKGEHFQVDDVTVVGIRV
ncbi:MAG: tetratricopeptide repeat protein [Candidatus Omnitrophica bacterium]|nr:tetratricopeptide repeat protein [Candidatus Omnitrophota bacterium]